LSYLVRDLVLNFKASGFAALPLERGLFFRQSACDLDIRIIFIIKIRKKTSDWIDSRKSSKLRTLSCVLTGNRFVSTRARYEKMLEEYHLFLELLNTLKRVGKISAEEWRGYREQWNTQKEGRNPLFMRLKQMAKP
jgi:hypothetical protein